jgi:hypothetical protein
VPHGVVTVLGVTVFSRASPSSARIDINRSDAATYCAERQGHGSGACSSCRCILAAACARD